MPKHMWKYLATIYEVRCAYAILSAGYTCPEGALDMKQCGWITVTEVRRCCIKKTKTSGMRPRNSYALAAACSKIMVFCHPGFGRRRSDPRHKGYGTLAKAKRSVALACTEIYVQTAIMVGRYLCGKPQDEDFGKDKADNLRDISQRPHQLVRTDFRLTAMTCAWTTSSSRRHRCLWCFHNRRTSRAPRFLLLRFQRRGVQPPLPPLCFP